MPSTKISICEACRCARSLTPTSLSGSLRALAAHLCARRGTRHRPPHVFMSAKCRPARRGGPLCHSPPVLCQHRSHRGLLQGSAPGPPAGGPHGALQMLVGLQPAPREICDPDVEPRLVQRRPVATTWIWHLLGQPSTCEANLRLTGSVTSYCCLESPPCSSLNSGSNAKSWFGVTHLHELYRPAGPTIWLGHHVVLLSLIWILTCIHLTARPEHAQSYTPLSIKLWHQALGEATAPQHHLKDPAT
jgi:hypothetical protein